MKKFKDSCSTTNRRQEIKAYEEISSPLVVSPLKCAFKSYQAY